MAMFDEQDDTEMKDRILRELVEKMHEILGDDLKSRHGMGVEVQADSPEGLKAGLEKAGEVVDKGPEHAVPPKSDQEQQESDESDLARLAEFADDEDDEDDEQKKFGR